MKMQDELSLFDSIKISSLYGSPQCGRLARYTYLARLDDCAFKVSYLNLFNPLQPVAAFLYPVKTSEKLKVF